MDIEQKNLLMMNAVFAVGANFFIQGKYHKAGIIFNGLTEVYPDYREASVAMGEVLIALGKFDEASIYFLELIDRFGHIDSIVLGAAKSYILSDRPDEAKKLVYPLVVGQIATSNKNAAIARSIYHGVN